jgi:hypothetical protein
MSRAVIYERFGGLPSRAASLQANRHVHGKIVVTL